MIRNILLTSSLRNQFSNANLRSRAFELNLINSTSQLDLKRNSRVLRRRITRLENDFEVSEEEISANKMSNHDMPNQRIITKNPRNLEQMLFEQKPLGWELDSKSQTYWNRVEFDKNASVIRGRIVHNSGRVLIEVSETDESLQDILFGKDSLTITSVIAQILARRCFETGIQYVHCEFSKDELTSKKLNAFVNTLKENGLILREPEFFVPRRANTDL